LILEGRAVMAQGVLSDPTVSKVLVTVHGIRTFGQWQERLGDLLRTSGFEGRVFHFKYGYFSSLAFLMPPLRFFMIRRFCRYLQLLRVTFPNATISFVGHSFGTHLIGWALYRLVKKSPFPGDLIVLAGSVLIFKPAFPWNSLISRGAARTVLNECGSKDGILVLNQLVALGLGFIGLLDDRFVNNYFAFGHSGYFLKDSRPDDHFMQSRWVKLLSDGVMPDRVDQRVPGGLLGRRRSDGLTCCFH
jgi:hypothetical protein